MAPVSSDAWLQSVMGGTCNPVAPRFLVDDLVDVLRACRLPAVEEVIGTGRIHRITVSTQGEPLHWVEGFPVARSVREIRLVRRGRISEDNHLLVKPRKTLAEVMAEEDEERRGWE